MNEVKEVCAAMLDEPEPPLRAGDEVFSAARSATRRRMARRLAGGGVALAGVVAVALAASGAVTWPAGGPASTGTATADRPARTTSTEPIPRLVAAAQTVLPELPSGEQVAAHGDKIYALLSAAVPSGYQAERRFGPQNPPALWFFPNDKSTAGTQGPDPATSSYVVTADLLIRAGGREGRLAATVWGDRRPAPTADLCSAEVNARMDRVFGPAESCQVITIGGLPMRVTTHHQPNELKVIHATWFVRNGFVTVTSGQGVPRYEPDTQLPPDAPKTGRKAPEYRPPLDRPLFTAEQLANVAANPDLLP